MHTIAVLVFNVARPEHRRRLRPPRPRSQPSLDSSFAPRQFLMSTRLHSKCPSCVRACWFRHRTLCSVVRTFRVFRLPSSRTRACTGSSSQPVPCFRRSACTNLRQFLRAFASAEDSIEYSIPRRNRRGSLFPSLKAPTDCAVSVIGEAMGAGLENRRFGTHVDHLPFGERARRDLIV